MLTYLLDLTASGALGAILNLYRPIYFLMQSISLLVLPVFSRLASNSNDLLFIRKIQLLTTVIGGIVTLYGAILTLSAYPLLKFLYAGKYDDHMLLIPLSAVWTTGSAVTGLIMSALKAKNGVSAVSVIYAFSAFTTLTIAIPLMQIWRLEVAGVAGIITQPATVLVSYLVLKRRVLG